MSFFFSSRRRHTRCSRDWSSDVCSSDLNLRYRVSTTCVSVQVHLQSRQGVSTTCVSGWVHLQSRLFNKLFRDIDARHAISTLRQLKREPPIPTRYIKQM